MRRLLNLGVAIIYLMVAGASGLLAFAFNFSAIMDEFDGLDPSTTSVLMTVVCLTIAFGALCGALLSLAKIVTSPARSA